jgi:hypothetical protein
MVRWLAVGLLLLVTASTAMGQSRPTLLRADPLLDNVSVTLTHGPELIVVYIHPPGGARPDPKWPEMSLQAWVLKSDGTALAPIQGFRAYGTQHWYKSVGFRALDPAELVAVVVSVDGVLFVRPIPKTPAN